MWSMFDYCVISVMVNKQKVGGGGAQTTLCQLSVSEGAVKKLM